MKENTFTGPIDHDVGQGNAAFISAALIALRDTEEIPTEDNVRAQAPNGAYLYFCREGGTVTQAMIDELLGPGVLPGWPTTVHGYTLIYEPEWWPIDHRDMPAFQVKRPSVLGSIGGDYVRGSTETPVVQFNIATVFASGTTAVIQTTVTHSIKSEWIIDVVGATPAVFNGRFKVIGTTSTNITYSLVTPTSINTTASTGTVTSVPPVLLNAVLKYPTQVEGRREAVLGQALLYVQAGGYDSVRIEWTWPFEGGSTQNWKEVALVRSMFGSPTTPMDGQTVFGPSMRIDWEEEDGKLVQSPVIYDTNLTGGYWYYYTLFFNISPKAPDLGDWVAGYSDWAQVPRRFGHDEHLWNGIPPYYQWSDDQIQAGRREGPLKKFLSIFGFELDFSRQSVECMQDMYHIDKTPVPLLRELGRNFGTSDEEGLGDIRFRASMADLAERLTYRGTKKGLQQTIETMSKYDSEVTQGKNLMMLPDDSSPFFSSGNWAGPHPDLGYGSYVRLNGTAGCYIDGPSLKLAGVKKFKWEFDCSFDDWTPNNHILAHQWVNGTGASWRLLGSGLGGVPTLWVTSTGNGAGVNAYTPSTANGYVDGSRHTVGGTWTADNGTNSTVQFTSDGANQGTLQTTPKIPAGLWSGSGPVEIGREYVGGGGTSVVGNIFSVKIWADDVLVASPDFTTMTKTQTSVTDAQGNVWALKGAATTVTTIVDWDKVQLEVKPPSGTMPGVGETGFLRIKASVTGDILATCGCGWIQPPVLLLPEGTRNQPGEYIPLTNGIPVEESAVYGFAAYLRNDVAGTSSRVEILWFDASGQPTGYISQLEGTPVGGSPGTFTRFAVSDTAPEGAVFMVPAIHIHSRPTTAAYVDMTGAMVYLLVPAGAGFKVTPPDRLLTLGEANETLGVPPKPGDANWQGYVLGSPIEKGKAT